MSMAKAGLITLGLVFATAAVDARNVAMYNNPYQYAHETYGLRNYYLHPYGSSIGQRYDPYWSYNSSYFPETYHGDGSYYGLGYSGYQGDGWYGNYWYW